MSTHIKVYPTKASALNVHHPIAGKKHNSEGVIWPYDVFTCRRLTDGSFTDDPAKAFKAAAEATEKNPAPAHSPDPASGPSVAKPAAPAIDAKK